MNGLLRYLKTDQRTDQQMDKRTNQQTNGQGRLHRTHSYKPGSKMSFWPIFETWYLKKPDRSEYNAIVMQMCSTCTLKNCNKKAMLTDFQAEKILYLSCKLLPYLVPNCNFLRNSDFLLQFLIETNKLTLIFLTLCKVFHSLTSLHKHCLWQ